MTLRKTYHHRLQQLNEGLLMNDTQPSQNSSDMANEDDPMQQQINRLQQQLQAQQQAQQQQLQAQQQLQDREVSRVSVKPVPFLKDEPDLYFIQLEAQFRNAKITVDQTKYDHAISQFDPKHLQMVTDLLRAPPDTDKYDTFKQRILKEFSDSQQSKLNRLIQEIRLGDDKPSQLLKRMKDLAGNSITDDALKSLWLQRLPESIRAVISIGDGDSTQWAKQADKMMEVTNLPSISAVSNPLQDEIAALRKEIAELKTHRGRSMSRSDGDKERPRARSKSKQKYPFCFYHLRFGSKARKCNEPCEFTKKSQPDSENK